MAHVTVEWTDNLEGEFDLRATLRLIASMMSERSDGVFPVGGIRVRGIKLTDYVIADDKGPDDAFINVSVLMGVGRSAEFKKEFFDRLFEALSASLGGLFDRRPLALSLYVDEAEGWKRNSIHRRLTGA
jgi:5-carboxymethyl-2-hydroxymuconate isomerase